jgi:hypothetical protein
MDSRNSHCISQPVNGPCLKVVGTESLGQILPNLCILRRHELSSLRTKTFRDFVRYIELKQQVLRKQQKGTNEAFCYSKSYGYDACWVPVLVREDGLFSVLAHDSRV